METSDNEQNKAGGTMGGHKGGMASDDVHAEIVSTWERIVRDEMGRTFTATAVCKAQEKASMTDDKTTELRWEVGQVWEREDHQWRVDIVYGDFAVLQSLATPWARTHGIRIEDHLRDGWVLLPSKKTSMSDDAESLDEAGERMERQLHTGAFSGPLFDPAVRCAALGDSPAEKLVRRLLWDLSPPGREPSDEAWAKVSTRDVKILAAAVASLGALRHNVAHRDVTPLNEPPARAVSIDLESLPLRLRHAAAGTGGYGPSDLAALLEEAAQTIAAQPGVAAEGEPMHSINMSALDLEDAIQTWAGERYGFRDGFWKATVKAPDEHVFVVAWELEDVPPGEEDADDEDEDEGAEQP